MRKSHALLGLIGLALLAALPLAGAWARRGARERCAQDGSAVEPLYRVRVEDARGAERVFCCVVCAEAWLSRAAAPRAVTVTDEVTGAEVPAAEAVYVRSLVVTTPATGNRVHAFRDRAGAEAHAAAHAGVLLEDEDQPFRRER